MKPAIPALSLALLLVAAPLLAQELAAPRFDAAAANPPALLDLPPLEAAPADHGERAPSVAAEGTGFSFRPILHALGGAVVGGWVGYVGAQVVKSDWDKAENGSFSGQRTAWVAAGAAVGMLGSWLIGETRSPRPGPLAPRRRSVRDRSMITAAEIRESGLQNALEVVTALRRDWLQTRGTNSWGESARGTMTGLGGTFQAQVVPGRDKIIVYLDDIRIGGVDDMADIDAHGLTSIRYLDGRQATYTYGSGHAHGAIVLSSQVAAP